jgi:ATP-dependent Clp protease ATP-binding subunit ClpA
LFFSQEEAACRSESDITPVHLLRALTLETTCLAVRVLTRVGISLEDIASKLEEDTPPGPDRTYKDIHLANDAIQCVESAFEEAKRLGQDIIGTEHILLGLMRDGGVAGSILASFGVSLDTLRNAVGIQRKDRVARIERHKPFHLGQESAFWVRFTERARKVVFYAQEESGRLGENYVSTEHLLLGLVRENDSVAARILDSIGVSLGRIRMEIERQVAHGDGRLGQDMQLTPRAKRVIDLAYEESRLLNNNYIGTEHLLLGLIREGEGVAGRVLAKLGVDLERTRREVLHLQEGGTERSSDHQRPATALDLRAAKIERNSVQKELNELPNNSSYEKARQLQSRLREIDKRIEALWSAGAGARWRRNPTSASIHVNSLIADAAAASGDSGQDSPSSEHFLIALCTAEDCRAMDVLNYWEISQDMVVKAIAGLASE